MSNAAMTFVYNEKVNLPIWINYYGKLFGYSNLYVVDQSSDDGSTDDLGEVNRIKIPRPYFDEDVKTHMMASVHSALTAVHDAVIVTDADEIIAADPAHFSDLNDYIAKMGGDYVNAIGLDVIHILNQEMPLDLSRPILSQRSYGRFHAAECKQLLSRVPIRWLPGLHASNKPPRFDPRLFLFHLKLMDYGFAMARHKINMETTWSEQSMAMGYGRHHRWDIEQFVKQSFSSPLDMVNNNRISEFDFTKQIEAITTKTVCDANGFYRLPMDVSNLVKIPDRFAGVF